MATADPISTGGSAVVESPSPWARTTSGFGMIVFLASDVMLFASVFAAYFLLRTEVSPWPPPDVELETLRAVLATVVLVSSSGSMVAAERAYERRDMAGLRRWTLVTMGLGGAFLVNQIAEYQMLDFTFDSHPYGSVYWMLTGIHTAHVAAGLGALGMLVVRGARARHEAAIEPWVAATAAFWHMVDVIWVAVFVTIWVVR
jgi:cytochrome c oxidase subunit 3